MFKKTFAFFTYFFLTFFFLFFFFSSNVFASFFYYTPAMMGHGNLNMILGLDLIMMTFLLMLSLVCSLVVLYSEMYMSHYNNKKFLMLMLAFIVSMAFLVMSESSLPFFMGWDGLGVTSICLIMFYPNLVTLYNSVLTMVYNRLGDILMIVCFAFVVASVSSNNFIFTEYSVLALSLIFFCSFTKSAQFPLSSWLPAAMSAPTPISAMVHSSTLVTAGILVVMKYLYYFNSVGFLSILVFVSLVTFFLGGLMAIVEPDFKKVVAFSTMSQISMILVFCSLGVVALGLVHMVFHALFKTLLFACSGLLFVAYYSSQNSFKISAKSDLTLASFLLFLSLYSMTGYLFSSSFFSKDLFLEMFFFECSWIFLFFIAGSCLTLFYCIKIFKACVTSNILFFSNFRKFYDLTFFLFFSIFSVYSGNFYCKINFLEVFPMLNFSGMFFILIVLSAPLIFNLTSSVNFFFIYLSKEIASMKSVTYSYFSELLASSSQEAASASDHLFFKPHLIFGPNPSSLYISSGFILWSLVLGLLM